MTQRMFCKWWGFRIIFQLLHGKVIFGTIMQTRIVSVSFRMIFLLDIRWFVSRWQCPEDNQNPCQEQISPERKHVSMDSVNIWAGFGKSWCFLLPCLSGFCSNMMPISCRLLLHAAHWPKNDIQKLRWATLPSGPYKLSWGPWPE